MLGIAYKQDIDDYRESPALKVIEGLEKEGAIVDFYDPYIETYKFKVKSKDGLKELNKEVLQNVDLIVITTAHTIIDYDFVQRNSLFIFDTKML